MMHYKLLKEITNVCQNLRFNKAIKISFSLCHCECPSLSYMVVFSVVKAATVSSAVSDRRFAAQT